MAKPKSYADMTPEERMKHDYEEAKRRRESGAGSNLFITPEVGDNIFRFLPGWKAGENWYRKVPVHYGIYPKNEKLAFVCPKVLYDDACPPCDLAEKLYAKGDKDSVKKASRFKVKDSYSSNVLIVSTPGGEHEGEVRVYRYGTTVFTQLVELIMSKWGNVTDPVKGRAVTIKRTGTGRDDTEYNVIPDPDQGPVPKEALKKIHNLDDNEGVIELFTEDELNAVMEGEELDSIRSARGGATTEAEEEKPAKDSKKPAAEPEPAKRETPDAKTMKKLVKYAISNDVEIGDDSDADVIFAKFVAESEGMKVKDFDDSGRFLKELGADISGKLVVWPEVEGGEPEAEPEGDGDDDSIEAQMAQLRKQREAAKGGKKK